MNQKILVFKDIKNKRWTLWTLDRSTHLGYRKTLNLSDCTFVVLEEKRKKVIKSGSRFPHAWIIGTLSKNNKVSREVTYNPFLNKNFVSGKRKVLSAKKAHLSSIGKVFI